MIPPIQNYFLESESERFDKVWQPENLVVLEK